MLKKILSFSVLILILGDALSQQPLPFRDTTLTFEERVSDLVSRLTLEEKVHQLFNQAPAIPRLEIPEYNWWNECLHGVARAGKATVFPQAIGLASTFDEPLMFRISEVISDEARAKHHHFVRNNARSIYMGLTFWTPNINIFRDPRWGRGQETYGEDPFLTSRMAVSFIKGLQGNDPRYFKTIATAKHYAVHSGPEFTRHSDNIFVNDRDLYETYLPAFRAAVREANVQSVMCAYNRFRDRPCCGSDQLLNSVLRNDFGFDGYVVSDCGAISDFFNEKSHHVVATAEQAWGWSLGSGTDLNCEESKWFLHNIDSAVQAGVINEKDIDVSVSRLFLARMKLGLFDPTDHQPYAQIPIETVGSPLHRDIALKAAEKSFVLLKNDGLLPLKKGIRIALVGPNANNPAVLIGNYNGDPIDPVTPLDGIRKYVGASKVFYTPGSALVPGVYTDFVVVPEQCFFHIENGKQKKGLLAEYYSTTDFSGKPKFQRVDSKIDFFWEKSPINHLVDEPFSVRWSGLLVPQRTGAYQFSGNVEVRIDGKTVDGNSITLTKGVSYKFEASLIVAAFWWASNHQQQRAHLLWTDTARDLEREAIHAAEKADVIVFCGGISSNLEGEEMKIETLGFAHGDRTDIELPPVQRKLLKRLKETGRPIVYINFSGSAIALNWESENLPAIIQGFYPGEATGTALAKILFGDINPSGRLPVTFYKSVDDLPPFKDYRMDGRTYRYFKGAPLFEFGYGLSYTSFSYDNLILPGPVEAGDTVVVSVDVTNTGSRAGEEVVQLYITHTDAKVPVPLRSLAAFKRVLLAPGETKNVSLSVAPEQFAVIDSRYRRMINPGEVRCSVGGKQPDAEAKANHTCVEKMLVLEGESVQLK